MRLMPVLETSRLAIRPFTLDDFEAAHRIIDHGSFPPGYSREDRQEWLQWTVLNYKHLGMLFQPQLGERAVALKETDEVVGAVGVVPYVFPFGLYPYFGGQPESPFSAEIGLFWATATDHRGKGYASEAIRAVIEFLFKEEKLNRVIATTAYTNLASQAIMRKLGMVIQRNPFDGPPWAQVLGILENPDA